jgi:molybdopterin molybdotransferase
VLTPGEQGPVVVPVGAQGSHLVADLAAATCLAVVPEAVTHVAPGDQLRCLPLASWGRGVA